MSKPQSDVYAGDIARTQTLQPPSQSYAFTITAEAEPDIFGKIANLFNLANLPPQKVVLQQQPEEQLIVTVHIGPLNPSTGEMISRKLRQLTFVSAVVTVPIPSDEH